MKKTSNQRADSKNPNNPAYKAVTDNRSRQLNKEDNKFFPKLILHAKNQKGK